jgi:hypothetical protein
MKRRWMKWALVAETLDGWMKWALRAETLDGWMKGHSVDG